MCGKRRKERWRGGSSCIRAYGVSVLGQVFTLAFVPRVRGGGRRELSVPRARFGRGSTRSIRERRGREGERQTIEDSRKFFFFLINDNKRQIHALMLYGDVVRFCTSLRRDEKNRAKVFALSFFLSFVGRRPVAEFLSSVFSGEGGGGEEESVNGQI